MKAGIKFFVYLFFLFSLFSVQNVSAQKGQKTSEGFPSRTMSQPACGMDESPLHTPEGIQARSEFLQFVKEFKAQRSTDVSSNKTTGNPNGPKYVIPTVVHVIFGNDRKDSLTYEQVFSQFVQLNNDFRRIPGTRGYGGGVDMQVEFSLATIDPDGNPTSGITYHKSADHVNMKKDEHNVELKTKIAPSWDSKRYFNIWLVKTIKSGGSGYQDLAGYAQFPDKRWWSKEDGEKTDGVVCINTNFGTTGTSGAYSSTMTHEIGHWLSLFHTFQGGCGGDCNTKGDGICDTPPVYSSQFKNPRVRINSCTDVMPGDRDRADNPLLYMDYTSPDDACNTFSLGQRDNAHAAMENTSFTLRNKLWSAQNIKDAGSGTYTRPKASFWVSNRYGCVNDPINFIDYSMSAPTQYEWQFPGGNPATSTDPSPNVTYDKPGKYSVTLVVKNESGISDTLIRNNFIQIVGDKVDVTSQRPFKEFFSSPGSPPPGWYVINDDQTTEARPITWQFARNENFDHTLTGVPDSTIGCAKLNFFGYEQYNQRDHLITPILDLTKAVSANEPLTFEFSYAYSPTIYQKTDKALPDQYNFKISESFDYAYIILYPDTMAVSASTDCGLTWKRLWTKGGRDLMTTSSPRQSNKAGAGDFEYAETKKGEWKKAQIDLDEYRNSSSLKIRFEGINQFGNWFYLDNVEINNSTIVSIEDKMSKDLASLKVMPNPFDGVTNVEFVLTEKSNVSLSVVDIQGKEVFKNQSQFFDSGKQLLPISLSVPQGIYLLKINVNGRIFTQKIVQE